MNNNLSHIFKNNWNDLQSKITAHWRKLSENDLKKIDGEYNAFVQKLEKVYGYGSREVEHIVNKFLQDEGLIELKDYAEGVGDSAIKVKNHVKESLQESAHDTKEKIVDVQKHCAKYVKNNPLKSVSAAVLIGAVAGKFFRK